MMWIHGRGVEPVCRKTTGGRERICAGMVGGDHEVVDGRRPSRVTRLGGRAGGAPPPLKGVGHMSLVGLPRAKVSLLYRWLVTGVPSIFAGRTGWA